MSTPLKPHYYIVKLGNAGVYLFFLFLLQNIACVYSLELPRREPTIYVLSKNMKKYKQISDEIFRFLQVKKSLYIAWASFHNGKRNLRQACMWRLKYETIICLTPLVVIKHCTLLALTV